MLLFLKGINNGKSQPGILQTASEANVLNRQINPKGLTSQTFQQIQAMCNTMETIASQDSTDNLKERMLYINIAFTLCMNIFGLHFSVWYNVFPMISGYCLLYPSSPFSPLFPPPDPSSALVDPIVRTKMSAVVIIHLSILCRWPVSAG